MTDNEQKFVTKDELTEVITAVLFKFSDEVMVPAMQSLFDETNKRIDNVNERLDNMDKRFDQIDNRLDEHETLIYRLIENGEKTDRRLTGMEKKLDSLMRAENEDVCALGGDVVTIKKTLHNHELRLRALGV